MSLSLELGMPVGEMLARVTSAELAEYRALFMLRQDDDIKTGLIASAGSAVRHSQLRAGLKGRR